MTSTSRASQGSPDHPEPSVFISHDSEHDSAIAAQVSKAFEACGFRPWIAQRNIPEGKNWREELDAQLNRCTILVVLWTTTSVNKPWCHNEAADALSKNKLHQFLIDIEPPTEFRHIQGAHFKRVARGIDPISLKSVVMNLRDVIGIKGPREILLQPRQYGEEWKRGDLAIAVPVPGLDIFVSFHPCEGSGYFSRMQTDTTNGWVRRDINGAEEMHAPLKDTEECCIVNNDSGEEYVRIKNEVFFINDPLRPYSIQIGRMRSKRPYSDPGFLSLESSLENVGLGDPGICELLAEVLSSEQDLQHLWDMLEVTKDHFHWGNNYPHRGSGEDQVKRVRQLIARNPSAPKSIQKTYCIFCSDFFSTKLCEDRDVTLGAYIISNAYPYGPYFHYVVIALNREGSGDPVHAWEELQFCHVKGMNIFSHRFLRNKNRDKNSEIRQSAGIEFGFNSTVKHLALGIHSRTSAGASIPHIHKQIWGMAPRTSNLSEHLILISDAYWRLGVDYQHCYYKALSEKIPCQLEDGKENSLSYVIWEDTNVALYVPYGQCSKHELQIVTKKPRAHLLELTEPEVLSISKAEYITIRIYKSMRVTSFNQILLTKLFNDHRAPQFRIVFAFVTREVDLAISELSMLYVVDEHPWDSRLYIEGHWQKIKREVLEEFSQEQT